MYGTRWYSFKHNSYATVSDEPVTSRGFYTIEFESGIFRRYNAERINREVSDNARVNAQLDAQGVPPAERRVTPTQAPINFEVSPRLKNDVNFLTLQNYFSGKENYFSGKENVAVPKVLTGQVFLLLINSIVLSLDTNSDDDTLRNALIRLLNCPDLNTDTLEKETVAAIKQARRALCYEKP